MTHFERALVALAASVVLIAAEIAVAEPLGPADSDAIVEGLRGLGAKRTFHYRTPSTLGWEGTSFGRSVRSVVLRALTHLQPGEIILMYVGANPSDHSTLDAHALARIISEIRAPGYGFVTVAAYF
jgi:hypothetical protein